jgi:hypothetical protein
MGGAMAAARMDGGGLLSREAMDRLWVQRGANFKGQRNDTHERGVMDDAFAILGSITPRIIMRSNMPRLGVEGLNIGEGRKKKPR